LQRGPLSEHLNSYAALLRESSYSQDSAQSQLLLVSRFSQWLQRNGMELCKVDEDVLQRFLRLRSRKMRIQRGEAAALHRLLTLLRQRKVVPPKSYSALWPRQKVTAEFGRYLLEERVRIINLKSVICVETHRKNMAVWHMAKAYRPYLPEQDLLLPQNVRDWLPEDHLVHFVSDVVDELDLSAIESVYEKEERGQRPTIRA
jgi:hypothetical protein